MEPSRKSSSRRSNARRSSARIHDLAITILEDGTIDMMPAVDMDPAAAVYFEKGAEVLLGKEIPGMRRLTCVHALSGQGICSFAVAFDYVALSFPA